MRARKSTKNVAMLAVVAKGLKGLKEKFVFVGGATIEAFSVPYLIASKLEAFRDRGRGDYIASPDIEDIVALLDGCPDVEKRLADAPETVKTYLAKEIGKLLENERFLDGLGGNLGAGPGGMERVERCLAIMRRIAAAS